ncbi:MAG: DMT family transporter [Oscillospiraceae bacterium]|nr:DMT family transporter [Oscillospiraceae bacterium]
MWLLFGILTTLSWGAADLFYKKGSDSRDPLSHLKIVVTVGFVMGLHAAVYALYMWAKGEPFEPYSLVIYLPVSFMYILSMTLGYVGLRYIELSVSAPIQNSSGAAVALMCFFILGESVSCLQAAAIVLISAGVFALSALEKKSADRTRLASGETTDKKYSVSAVAIIFPLLYCLVDAMGTFLDDIWLNEEAPKLSEDNALVAYELTFFICAAIAFIYIAAIKKEKLRIRDQRDRGVAALFEVAGQFFYVFIIGGSGVVVAPLVSAYCVVSMILSRVVLKEKLSRTQYGVAAVVVAGIVMLAAAES